jgi:hypothetical protein
MGKVKKQLKESVLSVLVETSKGAMRVMVRDVENVSEGFLKEMISNSRHEDKEDYKSENFRERTLAVPRGLRDCVFSLVHCKLLKYGPKSPFTIMTKSIGGMCDYYNLDLVKIFMAKIDYHTHTYTHNTLTWVWHFPDTYILELWWRNCLFLLVYVTSHWTARETWVKLKLSF